MNPSFWLVETFCLVETVCFNSELFLYYWISLLKLEGTNLKQKTFPVSGNRFLLFSCQKKYSFSLWWKRIFNEYFISGSANGFSGQYKPVLHISSRLLRVKAYFSFSGNVFFNEFSIPAIRELFFQVETDFMASGNHFCPCLRYFSRNPSSRLMETHFSVQKKTYCCLLRTCFSASGNHYLR